MLTVENYVEALDPDRQKATNALRKTISKNLPKGFEECIQYKMISYVVPKKTYPDGYHCDPALPLPFISLASQKGFIALYHMGLYSDPELLKWFEESWPTAAAGKLDMGKSCIRFKKLDQIPHDLIGALMKKITVNDWIERYETLYKKKKK